MLKSKCKKIDAFGLRSLPRRKGNSLLLMILSAARKDGCGKDACA